MWVRHVICAAAMPAVPFCCCAGGRVGGWPPRPSKVSSQDTLTMRVMSCALAAPWQQQQPGFVCPGSCRTCPQSAQRSACVRGVMWEGRREVLYCCSWLGRLWGLSHRPTCARHVFEFVFFLHCLNAPWSSRVAVLLVGLLPGWLALCNLAAGARYSWCAWGESLFYHVCYRSVRLDLRVRLVVRWTRAQAVDPGALQSAGRAPACSPCDAEHVTLVENTCFTNGFLCLTGTRQQNACFCQIIQIGDGDEAEPECACIMPDLHVCFSVRANTPIATRLLAVASSCSTHESDSPGLRQCWPVQLCTENWSAGGVSAIISTLCA